MLLGTVRWLSRVLVRMEAHLLTVEKQKVILAKQRAHAVALKQQANFWIAESNRAMQELEKGNNHDSTPRSR